MIRVADFIIEYLEQETDVEEIFSVSGGGSIFLCDALAAAKKMRYVCCHHEQSVGMAAEAYARVKNSLGVSLVTLGPGATNIVTGVAGSWMDSVPHLILSGQAFLAQTIGKTGLRQRGIQEINIVDIVRPITKYALMIEDAATIKYHLQKAIYLAHTGRPGPVWLDIPANIQNAKIDPSTLVEFDPSELSTAQDNSLTDKVAVLVDWLKTACRPLLHVGQGVKLAKAAEEFIRIVERCGIPFVTARNANDIVEWDHPLLVGRPGTFAQRGANFAVQNADVYLAIGTRLSLPQTGYNTKDYARNAKKAMVDIDSAELNKEDLPLDVRILADAGAFLRELDRQLGDFRFDLTAWQQRCQAWKQRYPVTLPEYREIKDCVNSYHFIDVLSDELNQHDIVVTDMGFAFQNTHQALRVKKGQKVFTNCGLASMGWGLPAAIGASFASNKQRVVCIAGEGGLQMNIQELATILHHQLPIKIFVFENGGYLTIKQTQELGFEGRLMGSNAESGLSFPNFLKLADAYGIASRKISNHDNLSAEIRAVLNSPGPMLCEVTLDHNQVQGPKAINKRLPDGKMQATTFEDLFPFLDPEEIKQNMSNT